MMPEINVPIPAGKISFVRDQIGVPRRECGLLVLAGAFRVTVAYCVDAFERETRDRDPAFVMTCGLAFCDVFGPDEFEKSEGRRYATEHLVASPLTVRVYVGQTVLKAVYTVLSKRSPRELRALHVPQRLISVFRAVRKQTVSRSNPYRAERCSVSAQARRTYNEAIASGKSREEAVVACRAVQ